MIPGWNTANHLQGTNPLFAVGAAAASVASCEPRFSPDTRSLLSILRSLTDTQFAMKALVSFVALLTLTEGVLDWSQVTSNAEWSERSSFQALSYQNSMIITGGYNVTSVWQSPDGNQWSKLTDATGISTRSAYPSTIVANSSIYSMGGCNGPYERFNDVWVSNDGGSTWKLNNPSSDWTTRCCFPAITYNKDTILILGGHDMANLNTLFFVSTSAWYLVSTNFRKWIGNFSML